MQKRMLRTVLTVTLLVAAVATAGLAQSRATLRAKVPFKFSVGSQLLPSGNYTVVRPGGSLVLIRSDRGKGAAFTQSIGKQGRVEANQTKLVFRRYGDQYFLAQMWTKGDVTGLTFPVSSAEKKLSNSNLARNLAVNQEAETITVTLD